MHTKYTATIGYPKTMKAYYSYADPANKNRQQISSLAGPTLRVDDASAKDHTNVIFTFL